MPRKRKLSLVSVADDSPPTKRVKSIKRGENINGGYKRQACIFIPKQEDSEEVLHHSKISAISLEKLKQDVDGIRAENRILMRELAQKRSEVYR